MASINFGIEVELWCRTMPSIHNVLTAIGWEKTYDGSIRGSDVSGHSSGDLKNEFRTCRYYTIDLENLAFYLSKIEKDYQKILACCRSIEVNDSMGIHFHVSNLKKTTAIFSREAFDFIHEAYKRFATTSLEKKRLGGHTSIGGRDTAFYAKWRYPRDAHDPLIDRYCAINYNPAWEKHKTIEFRFFPSTDKPEVLRKYCKFILEIVRKYENQAYPLERYTFSLEGSEDEPEIINMQDLIS